MGTIDFFTNWQLWQQMTFVLACSIVLVFFIGLCKLWWVNRLVRKHELLDEEKRSRISEIKKTGLSFGKRANIPFGVRAIQSGVEVDGIWISKPGTPNSENPLGASSLTLDGSDYNSKGKDKVTSESARTSYRQSPTSSTFESDRRPTPPPKSPTFIAQSSYKPRSAQQKHYAPVNESYSAGGGRHQEEYYERPALQTYVPTTSFSSARSPAQTQRTMQGDRSSSSSEEGLHMGSTRASSQRRSNYSHPKQSDASDKDYHLGVRESSATPENPFTTPEPSLRRVRVSTAPQASLSPPTRTYPGETHVSRTSRRYNAGPEILPVGTFSASTESTANGNLVDLERGEGTRSSSRYLRPVVSELQGSERNRSLA